METYSGSNSTRSSSLTRNSLHREKTQIYSWLWKTSKLFCKPSAKLLLLVPVTIHLMNNSKFNPESCNVMKVTYLSSKNIPQQWMWLLHNWAKRASQKLDATTVTYAYTLIFHFLDCYFSCYFSCVWMWWYSTGSKTHWTKAADLLCERHSPGHRAFRPLLGHQVFRADPVEKRDSLYDI